MSDFDENFFDGFDEEEQAFLDDEDLLDDIIEDDEEEGVNRTFLIAGLGLVGVFLAAIVGIVLLASGGDDSNAQATNDAILTANAADALAFASTSQAEVEAEQTAQAAALTAEFEANQTAFAGQTQTEDAAAALVDQTRTAIARDATATEHFFETQSAITILSLTPPSLTPTETPEPIAVAGNLDPANTELTIYIIRDDNGDGQVSLPATPAPPTPTLQPTLTPQSTATITLPPTEFVIPDDLAPADASATIAAATQRAELDADRATVDAVATFRAEQNTPSAAAPTEVSDVPPDVSGDATDIPPDTDTDTVVVPDGDVTEPDISETLIQSVVSVSDRVSVLVPDGWEVNDQIETLGILYIGDSLNAIETRAVLEGEAPPPVVGVGGQIIPQTLADTGAEEVTPELLAELLAGSLEAVPDIDLELGTVEEPIAISFDNGVIGHYIILTSGNEQSILAYLGFAEDVALVNLSSTVEEFDANRDLLFAIMETISVPAEIDAEAIGDGDTTPLIPEETEEFDDEAQGSLIDPFDNGVMFFRNDANAGNIGVYQDGGTPTQVPGGDTIISQGTFAGGQQIVIEIPVEAGIYYVVTDLPPGEYTLTLDGTPYSISVPTVVDETVPTFVDVPLNIGGEGQTVILRVFVRGIGGGATPVPPSDLSPFLQTATAVAGQGQPAVTATVSPETLPTAGGALDSGGLTLLAILGAGLIGVVFVVRRLRSETYA
jgi:hypothetical protein